MAKFKIELEWNGGRFLLTDFDSTREKQTELTFDENLEEGENDSYTLSFSIPDKINGIPIGALIVINRPLWLTFGNPQREVRMVISSINERRGEGNKIYEIEAQDYASYVYSKNNAGLSFNSFEDEDFLNIMGEEKATVEDIGKYILERGWLRREEKGWDLEYIRTPEIGETTDDTLKYVNIEVDNSNTYNALIELANAAQSILRFNYGESKITLIDNEDITLNKQFLLKEDFNLQELGLSKQGDELFGLMYVDGIQNEDGEYTFMDDEIAYRDNFLYDLDYFKDSGLLTENQVEEIKNRIEGDLLKINQELETVIGLRYELEGQIRALETATETYTYPLVVEPTEESFAENYKKFEELFRKEIVNHGSGGYIGEGFYYEDFLENGELEGIEKTIIKMNRMLVLFNGNNYLFFGENDGSDEKTNEVKIRINGEEFTILFSKKPISGFTLQGGSLASGSDNFYLYVKNDNSSNWKSNYNEMFEVEKAWFRLKISNGDQVQIEKTYPYFDLLNRLGGINLIDKKIAERKKMMDNIYKDWREDYKERVELEAQKEGTLTGPEETQIDQKIALIDEHIESYRLVVGGYRLKNEGDRIDDHEYESPLLNPQNWIIEEPTGIYKLIYNMMKRIRDEYPVPAVGVSILTQFFILLARKREFWYNLKTEFGAHIFTEGYYEDDLETDSLVLYHQAKRAQQEHKKPLEEIQATYINLSHIINIDIEEPRVGDYIWISKKDERLEEDKRLKVQGISRTLRLDGNIEYEITKFNPGNRLIEKLVKQLQSRRR